MFKVSSVWGNSRSQQCFGKSSATLTKIARKWALKVQIARLAAFLRWIYGGTSWNFIPYSDVMVYVYTLLA